MARTVEHTFLWFGLDFFHAMTTSDLPLLGEKKSRDVEGYEARFSLVWFGLVFPPSNDDL
jgi:hypothetical protein